MKHQTKNQVIKRIEHLKREINTESMYNDNLWYKEMLGVMIKQLVNDNQDLLKGTEYESKNPTDG